MAATRSRRPGSARAPGILARFTCGAASATSDLIATPGSPADDRDDGDGSAGDVFGADAGDVAGTDAGDVAGTEARDVVGADGGDIAGMPVCASRARAGVGPMLAADPAGADLDTRFVAGFITPGFAAITVDVAPGACAVVGPRTVRNRRSLRTVFGPMPLTRP
ncbi:MAG TPA: hypothetical protein VGF45_20470, partial [Polyangia bacterium]